MAEWLSSANDFIESVDQTDVEKTASVKTELNKTGVFEILQDPETYATVLLAICLINYGDETFKVEPLTLFQWLKEDFGTELHEDNENKLQAILIALTTDYFFTDVNVFQNICKTLQSGDPDIYEENFMEDKATAPEIMWGIYEVSLNSEDTVVDNMQFSSLVETYIDNILTDDVDDLEEDNFENEEGQQVLTPSSNQVVSNNVAEMKQQLLKIGIKEIPIFPTVEI